MVNHRRGPWSQAEDLYLVQLVQRDGASNWVRISHAIATRSPKQCRERYHQNLKPSLNHDPITPEEGEQIEKMVTEMGKRWAEIARRLKGRSDNAVKNWWNGGQNRRRRGHEHRRSDGEHSAHAFGIDPMDHHQHYLAPEHDHSAFRRSPLPTLDTGRFPHHDAAYYAPSRYPLHPNSNSAYPPNPQSHTPLPPSMRPAPLNIHVSIQHHGRSGHPFDTPMPSPSVSIVSNEGAPPSLITDSGSETRSPNYANSPHDGYALPPTIGGRDERRRSSIRYLPKSGFVDDDDFKKVHLAPIAHHASDLPKPAASLNPLQLPSPQCMVQGARAEHLSSLSSPHESTRGSPQAKPIFREPNYASHSVSPSVTPFGAPMAEPKKMALSSILA